jgi:hypothetical protein
MLKLMVYQRGMCAKKNAMNLGPSHCLLISLAINPLLIVRDFRG